MRRFSSLLVLGLLIVAVAGCKHKTPPITPLPPPGQTGTGRGGGGGARGVGPGVGMQPGQGVAGETVPGARPGDISQGLGHDGWIEDASTLAGDTVHFEYDRSEVRSEEKVKVTTVAQYLKNNAANAVKIEGHCDERGTEEYNRALGERRALALREELVSLGVDPARIDTISFGKDRPVDSGHDDAAWARNRRGVFLVLTPPK
jgi:peptidoglycan-associated lipoprotein